MFVHVFGYIMSYFMSFVFYGTILCWVSCIQFMHIFYLYHVLIYLFFGGGYVLLVFVTHYIMFSCIIWCSCWEYFFLLCVLSVYYGVFFLFFWYFACITHSVYLSFLCLSKLSVFIFSLSFNFFD